MHKGGKTKQVSQTIFFKVAYFVLALFLVFTKTTDADLLDLEVIPDNTFIATTLDFSNRSTANNLVQSTLFNVVGMIPGGFQVESLRIKQDGELDFDYQITTEILQSDNNVCDQLNIKILRDFRQIYNGPLSGFSLSSAIVDGKNDDLVLFIDFNNQDISFTNKTCNFSFKFVTRLNESGFVDEEVVQNQITTGMWSTSN